MAIEPLEPKKGLHFEMTALVDGRDPPLEAPRSVRRRVAPPVYSTQLGTLYLGDSLRALKSKAFRRDIGKAQLVLTSPPFPLKTQKEYGNREGQDYIRWFASYARLLRGILTNDRSIVVEIGNVWEAGRPVMSTVVLHALLRFLQRGGLHLCQEFIWYNPARLPSPAQWVTIERIRVKDAFTRIWWMSSTDRPKADNRRVLQGYSDDMKRLLERRSYNAGRRPSEHLIGATSFFKDNAGAIPPNVGDAEDAPSLTTLLKGGNNESSSQYQMFCRDQGLSPHPARMPQRLAEFFIKFLTEPGDMVFDPFAGSNTTGAVAEDLKRRWAGIELNDDYAVPSLARFDAQAIKTVSDGIELSSAGRAGVPITASENPSLRS